MTSDAAKNGGYAEGFAPITISSMAEERQAVAAKVAEVEALKQQLDEHKQELIKAHCRGDQLPEGVVMVWKTDFDQVKKFRSKPRASNYCSAYHSMSEYSRPEDSFRLMKCANCSVYYKDEETLHKNFSKQGDNSVTFDKETPKYSCPICGSQKTTYWCTIKSVSSTGGWLADDRAWHKAHARFWDAAPSRHL